MIERYLGDGVRAVFDGRELVLTAKRPNFANMRLDISLSAVDELILFMRQLERRYGSLPAASRAVDALLHG